MMATFVDLFAASVPFCCICSRKQTNLGITLHPHIFLVANSLFPFCKVHLLCVDLHTTFLVISLHFGTQDVLVVKHKPL